MEKPQAYVLCSIYPPLLTRSTNSLETDPLTVTNLQKQRGGTSKNRGEGRSASDMITHDLRRSEIKMKMKGKRMGQTACCYLPHYVLGGWLIYNRNHDLKPVDRVVRERLVVHIGADLDDLLHG